ncbi:MAG: ParB/RepB/Spo0J family partition protein [Planctomycetota bacterium]
MEKKLGRGLDRLFARPNDQTVGQADLPVEEATAAPRTVPLSEGAPASVDKGGAPTPKPLQAIEPVQPARTTEVIRSGGPPAPPTVQPTNPPDGRAGRPTDQTDITLLLRTDQLIPNRFQPRKTFDKAALSDLMESIKSAGVLQPILVRKSGNYYEIVAGERRWRACVELKIASVPVIVKDVDDQKMLEWALIENTQRKDLNPIERARAYKELMTFFNLTQEEIAGRVGLDRATVANFIRLLELPSEVQDELAREAISTTHARGLLAINDPALQIKLCQRIKKEGMSVRRLEYIIRWLKRRKPASSDGTTPLSPATDPHIRDIEERLMAKFSTKVTISTPDNKQGKVMISFYSLDDLQRILDKIDQIK